MTDAEIRATIRQMLADWQAATPEQREAAMVKAGIAATLASGHGKLPPPPPPYDRGAYERGWRYSARPGANLDHLDNKGAPGAEYDGYMDQATGREKWHLAWCGVNHRRCPQGS